MSATWSLFKILVKRAFFLKASESSALVTLALLIADMFTPDLPFFSLIHLMVMLFGVKLAFEKKTDLSAKEQLAA
ncbi:hypothetical protein E5161_18685 [Cohnella pontilimi]|uniref:Uncharacterized protein n=1 Tax=Cohnella pontilimi TaxID=2564100 RepID=A0A4U0F4U3_9BACL|nr:hypothetical protein [Cohnella pontilimi]TJY39601.1 hypothetical protein E5161_18685 [Cohnella pontilimi]